MLKYTPRLNNSAMSGLTIIGTASPVDTYLQFHRDLKKHGLSGALQVRVPPEYLDGITTKEQLTLALATLYNRIIGPLGWRVNLDALIPELLMDEFNADSLTEFMQELRNNVKTQSVHVKVVRHDVPSFDAGAMTKKAKQFSNAATLLESQLKTTKDRLETGVDRVYRDAAHVLTALDVRARHITQAARRQSALASKVADAAFEEADTNWHALAAMLGASATANAPTAAYAAKELSDAFGASSKTSAWPASMSLQTDPLELPVAFEIFGNPPSNAHSMLGFQSMSVLMLYLADEFGKPTGVLAEDISISTSLFDVNSGKAYVLPIEYSVNELPRGYEQNFKARLRYPIEHCPPVHPVRFTVGVRGTDLFKFVMNIQNKEDSVAVALQLPDAVAHTELEDGVPKHALLMDIGVDASWIAFAEMHGTLIRFAARNSASGLDFTDESTIDLLEPDAAGNITVQLVEHVQCLSPSDAAAAGLEDVDVNNCAFMTRSWLQAEAQVLRLNAFNRLLGRRTLLFEQEFTSEQLKGALRDYVVKDGMFVLMTWENFALRAYIRCLADGREAWVTLAEQVPYAKHFSIHGVNITPSRIAALVSIPIEHGVMKGVITNTEFTADFNANYAPASADDRVQYSFQTNEESDDVVVVGRFKVAQPDHKAYVPAQCHFQNEVRKYADGHCVFRARLDLDDIVNAVYRNGTVHVLFRESDAWLLQDVRVD